MNGEQGFNSSAGIRPFGASEGSSEPLVSVIVVNWNGRRYIDKCLNSLSNQSYNNYEVIVVDNHSEDDSVDIVRTRFPTVKLIALPTNIGFAKGNNVGFFASKAKYVIALNNDTEVQPNFVETLVNIAESNDSIGSVGCKIVQYDGSLKYGPVYSVEGGIVAHRPVSSFLNSSYSNEKRLNHQARVLANCACAVLYRRKILEEIGGFDPLFISNWEDHDLGIRMNLAGYTSIYTPSTTVLHAGGASEGSPGSTSRLALITRGILIAHYKNFGLLDATMSSSFGILLAVGFSISEWRDQKVKMITPLPILGALVKGITSFVFSFRKVYVVRLQAQKFRRLSDKEIRVRTDVRQVC